MLQDEFDKSFSTLIGKLGHPVEEIRLRALDNLQAKFNLKLIADNDILQYKYLYIKLLEWFNFPSPSKRDIVLHILLKLSKVS
jgi:rotatin